jgi:hypothetical protein
MRRQSPVRRLQCAGRIEQPVEKGFPDMSLRLRHILLVLCFVSGCSVVMEATRPTPVDLEKFQPGDSRSSVTQELGSPVTTSKGAGATSCDLYLLYTKGYGVAGKAPIAVGELAADVFTVGLAEIVLSPTEAATRNEKRTVWFCYQNDALLSVTVKSAGAEPSTSATPTPSPESMISSSAPSVASTPAPSAASTPTDLAAPSGSNSTTATPSATPSTGEQSQRAPASVR